MAEARSVEHNLDPQKGGRTGLQAQLSMARPGSGRPSDTNWGRLAPGRGRKPTIEGVSGELVSLATSRCWLN